MIYVDNGHSGMDGQLVAGAAYDKVNRWFGHLKRAGQAEYVNFCYEGASSQRTPLEQRLVEFQNKISGVSMHLPKGFAAGLNRQFANLMDDDAWEDGDELPALPALSTFLTMLIRTHANRRPGIGTNGRGSITAFWKEGTNRLTVECYAAGRTTWVLTRADENGNIERAAGECPVARLLDVVLPYGPGVWFGQ